MAIFTVILLAAVLISGCAYVEKVFNLAPTPTPKPVITITPTPAPTPKPTTAATPIPTLVARQMSNDVKVMPFGQKGLIDFSFIKGVEEQNENVTVVLGNDGSSDASNVVVTLTVTDAIGANTLIQQKYKVGDLHRGDRKELTMQTEDHGLASSVLLDVNVDWGKNGEYYNPTTFVHVARSVWM